MRLDVSKSPRFSIHARNTWMHGALIGGVPLSLTHVYASTKKSILTNGWQPRFEEILLLVYGTWSAKKLRLLKKFLTNWLNRVKFVLFLSLSLSLDPLPVTTIGWLPLALAGSNSETISSQHSTHLHLRHTSVSQQLVRSYRSQHVSRTSAAGSNGERISNTALTYTWDAIKC